MIALGKPLRQVQSLSEEPDWSQANPRWIERALAIAQAKSNGGWWVLDASRRIAGTPRRYRVNGCDLVAFRGSEGVVVGPDACPHMGASLSDGRVEGDRVVCPWHGLELGCKPRGSWRPYKTFDDGVLVWTQTDTSCTEPTERPLISDRPRHFVDAVVTAEARCEPRDIIANRLDPWHGTHFHPYAFARLSVLETKDDEVTVRVAKRVVGPICVEVDARFHCPDSHTIVMTIVGGEGEGSVVETHAAPIDDGRTLVIEANLASSDRRAFRIARGLNRIVRPLMHRSAKRLWLDDCAYAERLYALRQAESR